MASADSKSGRVWNLLSDDRTLGKPLLKWLSSICKQDIFLQCYFVHIHLQQFIIQATLFANQDAIFVDYW